MTNPRRPPALKTASETHVLIEQLKDRATVERNKAHRDFELLEMLLEAAFQLKMFNERRTR